MTHTCRYVFAIAFLCAGCSYTVHGTGPTGDPTPTPTPTPSAPSAPSQPSQPSQPSGEPSTQGGAGTGNSGPSAPQPDASSGASAGDASTPAKLPCPSSWSLQAGWCVMDTNVESAQVCHFDDAPVVQENLYGEMDECAKSRDPGAVNRAFECTTSFAGKELSGMVVDHGEQIVTPFRGLCRLSAKPIF